MPRPGLGAGQPAIDLGQGEPGARRQPQRAYCRAATVVSTSSNPISGWRRMISPSAMIAAMRRSIAANTARLIRPCCPSAPPVSRPAGRDHRPSIPPAAGSRCRHRRSLAARLPAKLCRVPRRPAVAPRVGIKRQNCVRPAPRKTGPLSPLWRIRQIIVKYAWKIARNGEYCQT